MADNVAITAGAGTSIATDEVTTVNGSTVAAVQAQRVKVGYGVDGDLKDVTPSTGLPIQGITGASTTASWVAATALNTAATISIAGMNAVSVTLVPTTPFTTGAITFEVSPDNLNWIPIAMARIDTYTTESTYTIAASTNRGWTTSVDGFNNFRVRLSTAITGAGTAAITIIPQAFAIEPIVTVGQATAASLNATVVPGSINGNAIPAASIPQGLSDGTNLVAQRAVNAGADAVAAVAGMAGATTFGLLFNGTTWDRYRSNFNVNTGDTGAKTATGTGATQTNFNARGANIVINVGAVSGTTPTCVFKVQESADNGTTWYDVPNATTTSITAGSQTFILSVYPGNTALANQAVSYPLGRTWRMAWTIGGTTPSFTITNIQVAYIL